MAKRSNEPIFNTIDDFKIFIHEDECYDENGVFSPENMRKDMELGTLLGVGIIASDMYYNPTDKDFYSIIRNLCKRFNVDVTLLKKSGSKNYKNIPRKYWGIVLQCVRYAKTPNLDNERQDYSYLYYLATKTRYNSIDEFEEQIMIKNFIDYLEEYINTCICEKKQFLFSDEYSEKMYVPFNCMRYVENEYLCNNLAGGGNIELTNMILEVFENMSEFKEYIDNPKNFEKLKTDNEFGEKFIKLWNDFVSCSKKKDDFPKSYQYSECFCENEVKTLLEGLAHSNGLNNFYSFVKNDYLTTLENLQAIVDMNYVVNLYESSDEKKYSYKQCSEITQFIREKYDEIVERFIPYIKQILNEANDEPDDIKKFKATMTKWITLNALSENRVLCESLQRAGIQIQYEESNNSKKA